MFDEPKRCLTAIKIITILCLITLKSGAATRTVTHLGDSGPGSFRQTVMDATDGDSISFGVNGVLVLTTGEVAIGKNLFIVGPGPKLLTIDANNNSRVLHIVTGEIQISGLTISSGFVQGGPGDPGGPGVGGGLLNSGGLFITDCVFSNNIAKGGQLTYREGSGGPGQGGGLANAPTGVAALQNCTFISNQAFGGNGLNSQCTGMCGGGPAEGGGVFTEGSMTIINCTFYGNRAEGGPGNHSGRGQGGGVFSTLYPVTPPRRLLIINSTISNNVAAGNTSWGGGLGTFGFTPPGSNIVWNSVIAGNVASYSGPDVSWSITSWGHNLIGVADGSGGWVSSDLTGSTASPLDPRLWKLEDAGGKTPSMAIRSGPAVDGGDDGVLSSPWNILNDQRGQNRRLGRHVDIGSVETPPPTAPTLLFSRSSSNATVEASFSHSNGTIFDVIATTNVTQPLSNWTILGTPIDVGGGLYKFKDTNAANQAERFFRLKWP
jgi:hypothetical protein